MLINLSNTMPKTAGEAAAKPAESGNHGAPESFFDQMGQALNPDGPGEDAATAEESEKPGQIEECNGSLRLIPGATMISLNPINAEPVQAPGLNVSASTTEAENSEVELTEDTITGVMNQSAIQPVNAKEPAVSKDQSCGQAKAIVDPVASCEFCPLEMSLVGLSSEAATGKPETGSQNIDSSREPSTIKPTVPVEAEPIPNKAVEDRFFETALELQEQTSSERTAEEPAVNPRDTQTPTVPAADPDPIWSASSGKNNLAQAASVVDPVKQKVPQIRTEAAKKDDSGPQEPQIEQGVKPDPPVEQRAAKPDIEAQQGVTGAFRRAEKGSSQSEIVRKAQTVISDTTDNPSPPKLRSSQSLMENESDVRPSAKPKVDGAPAMILGKPQTLSHEHAQEMQHPSAMNPERPPVSLHAAGPAAESTAKPQGQNIALQIADQIQYLVRDGKGEIRIQLKPDVLGRIEIKAEATPAGVTARITTESANVKLYLESNMQLLQQTLSDQGLRIERIQIVAQDALDMQNSSGQNALFGNSGFGRNGRDSGGSSTKSEGSSIEGTDEAGMEAPAWLSMNPNGRFHTVA